MAKGLSLIFWGLLLMVVDVRLGSLDVLPDAAGYAMMAVGAGRLAGAEPRFAAMRLVAWVMVLPGLVDAVVPLNGAPLPAIVEILGQAVLVWNLLTAIAVFTAEGGRPDLARRARQCRAAEVALAAAGLLLTLASVGGAGVAGPGIVLVPVNLVVLAVVLHLVHRVRGELAPEAAVPRGWGPAAYPPRG